MISILYASFRVIQSCYLKYLHIKFTFWKQEISLHWFLSYISIILFRKQFILDLCLVFIYFIVRNLLKLFKFGTLFYQYKHKIIKNTDLKFPFFSRILLLLNPFNNFEQEHKRTQENFHFVFVEFYWTAIDYVKKIAIESQCNAYI